MRDAPFGFVYHDPWRVFALAAETARTTHGHPSASSSSGALATIIMFLAQGRPLLEAVKQTLSLLKTMPDAHEVQDALGHALRLSETADWRERLPDLGGGWVAEEALAISVLCALAADNSREAIIAAVNHSGDSDSTGSITGNLVGTWYGLAALPNEWVEQVELRDVIEILGRDLAIVLEGEFDSDMLWERYPGW
ncbi:ADP-ribosylglycohydrolase family protein [Mesorhizobium sp.]|uniref:ADP-ribosylglycohydrolase family protein n=1 Tax=Mesorhizobium sp. TaxID=1871066 RepID=UPI00257BC637|nr:ADP-ribosylglycohydrolase family protein [Mesorhizobium sp.]